MSRNGRDDLGDWPRRAVEWHILLREEDNDLDVVRHFEMWRAADPARDAEWRDVVRTMGLLKAIPDEALPIPVPTMRTYWKKRWKRRLPKIGMGVLASTAIAGIMVLIGPDMVLRWQADYLTGRQETRILELADGSQATLAPESAVALDFLDGHRHVRLLKGEALFTVHHDTEHPFSVLAGHLTITDVGTVFDVRLESRHEATVGVREGRVSVQENSLRAPPVILDAGEQAQLRDHHLYTSTIEPGEVGLWSRGLLVAHDQPVAEVAAALQHYIPHGKLFVYGEKLRAERVTGTYPLTEPEKAFETLAEGQKARVFHATPWLTLMTN